MDKTDENPYDEPMHQWPTWMYTRTCTLTAYPLPIQVRHSRVEWFSIFCNFRKWLLTIGYIFKSSIPKNRRPHGKVFFFKKSHKPLKKFFCKYLSFTSKKNRQKENLGNIFYIFYFRPPKWAKTVFYLVKGKMIFWSFSIFLAFK